MLISNKLSVQSKVTFAALMLMLLGLVTSAVVLIILPWIFSKSAALFLLSTLSFTILVGIVWWIGLSSISATIETLKDADDVMHKN